MKEMKFALNLISPIMFTYFFTGSAFGMLAYESGFSLLMIVLSSTFIYAGSMQILMVPLLGSGASVLTVALTTFFVNARHIFYGMGFIDRFKAQGALRYPYMIMTFTDEVFSIFCLDLNYPEDLDPVDIDFYVSFLCHSIWIIASLLGGLLGSLISIDISGIEFSVAALFISVVVDQWRRDSTHIPALLGFGLGLIYYVLLGTERFLMPALVTVFITLILIKDIKNMEKVREQIGSEG